MATESTCVVVGGSISGTFAAAAAAPYFDKVLVVDRDKLETRLTELARPNLDYHEICSEAARHRSVFQGMQMHVLLAGGAESIEKILPGFKACCLECGATLCGDEAIIGKNLKINYGQGQLGMQPAPQGYSVMMATRILFERCARAKLLELYHNVHYQMPCKIEDVVYDSPSSSVKGVKLSSHEEIPASLVIDATGGRSHAIALFLQDKCRQAVETVKYEVNLSYHTRFFRIPDKVLQLPRSERTYLSGFMPRAPLSGTGMYQVVEGNMYQALVSRMNGEKCSPKLEDFLEFLKSLPDQDVYEALKDAEPLGPAFDCLGVKGTERYYYERLNMPENYVVLGDALAHLNPRFGSGMTAAAFQASTLRKQLAQAQQASDTGIPVRALTAQQLKGYSNRIQREAAKAVELPYSLVRDGDLKYDFCKGPRPTNPIAGVMGTYIDGLMDLLPGNNEIAATWMMVMVFLLPPTSFFKPSIVKHVLTHLISKNWAVMSGPARLSVMSVSLLVPALILALLLRA